jgi:20S proteasome subunit alpha 7
MYVQAYTLYSSVRPFGCSTIVGGVDNTGPQLFIVEPSGVAYVCCYYIVAFCGTEVCGI